MRRLLLIFLAATLRADDAPPGNALLDDYFAREVAAIEALPPLAPASAQEWETQRAELRSQLAEMLGLSPMPERTPLATVKTGEEKADGFVVEKLHFQSLPGLYVTANLYRPAKSEGRLPAVLYVCGHSRMPAKDGGSLGNKTGYQHHGAWFARHGYVCLVIDTVQLGEITGEHHGTYSKGRWWWFSRGYTPAGIEAWNGIRALDYLVSREDVDAEKIGMTGRSGGGAYSWWVAALDDRVKVVAPTAGITTLRNHVVDGCIEGHCDCMYHVNTRRWDFDRVAALVAPRPLLISNTDKDTIFPLDGVIHIYNRTRTLYRALGSEAKIGLQIAEGPHKDTQALNTGAFAWFERWLKGADLMALLDEPAKKHLDPEQLRVFTKLPEDERNTRIDEQFLPVAKQPPVPENSAQWCALRSAWMDALRTQSFGGWPEKPCDPALCEAGSAEHEGVVMKAWDFTPQEPWSLRLYVAHRAALKPEAIELVVLNALDAQAWEDFRRMMAAHFPTLFSEAARDGATGDGFADEQKMFTSQKWAMAYVAPRGVGPAAWSGTEKKQTQRLRRFYLLGQTLDGMQTWDIRRSIAALRAAGFAKTPLWIQAQHTMAGNALYASLFENDIARLDLHNPPATHADGPFFLNVMRHLDMPQAAAMAAGRSKVRIYSKDADTWKWAADTAAKLGWEKSFEVREPLK